MSVMGRILQMDSASFIIIAVERVYHLRGQSQSAMGNRVAASMDVRISIAQRDFAITIMAV